MENDSKNKDTIINLLDKDNQFKDTLNKKLVSKNIELNKENKKLNQSNNNKVKIITGLVLIIIIETLIIVL